MGSDRAKNNKSVQNKPDAKGLIKYLTGKTMSVGGAADVNNKKIPVVTNIKAVNKMLAYLGGADKKRVWRVVKDGTTDTARQDYLERLYKKSHSLYSEDNEEAVPYEDFKNIVQCYNWGKYDKGKSISNPTLKTEYQKGITDVLKDYPELCDDSYYETVAPIIEMLKDLKDKKCFSKIAQIQIESDIESLIKNTNVESKNNILDRIIDQLKIIFREKKLGEYTTGESNKDKIVNITAALERSEVQQMIQHSDLYLAASADNFKESVAGDPAYSVPKGQVKAFLGLGNDVKELYLTGRPGSGKSMLFDYLTKQTPQTWFVIDQKMSLKTIQSLITKNKDANFILDEYDLLYADPEIKKLIDSITGKKIIATATPNKAFIVNKIQELANNINPKLSDIANIVSIANNKEPTTEQAKELKEYIDALLVLAGNAKDLKQKHYINQIINLAEPLYTKVLIECGQDINKDKTFAKLKTITKMDTVFETKNVITEHKDKSNLAIVLQDCFAEEKSNAKPFCNILQMTTGFEHKDIEEAFRSITSTKKDFFLLVKKRGDSDVLYSINKDGEVVKIDDPAAANIYGKNVLCVSDYLRVNIDNKIGKVGTIYYDNSAPFECEGLQSDYRNRVHNYDGSHNAAEIKFVDNNAKASAKIQYDAFIDAEYNTDKAVMRPKTGAGSNHNRSIHNSQKTKDTQNDKYMAVCIVCGFSCKDTHEIENATCSDYLIVVDIKTGMPSKEHSKANTKDKLEKYIKMLDKYAPKQTNTATNSFYSNTTINSPTSILKNKKNTKLVDLEEYKEAINNYIKNNEEYTENEIDTVDDKEISDEIDFTTTILPITEEKFELNFGGKKFEDFINTINNEYLIQNPDSKAVGSPAQTKLQEQNTFRQQFEKKGGGNKYSVR